MTQVHIQSDLPTANPTLLLVTNIDNPLPPTTYSLHYRNHTAAVPTYHNISQLQELFLPHPSLQLKIINFEEETEPVFVESQDWQQSGQNVTIGVRWQQYTIRIEGRVLNQTSKGSGVVDISVVERQGYQDFYKFRKKYKALQNITKQLEFHVDHRLIAVIGNQRYQFNLQVRKTEHFYLDVPLLRGQVKFLLEEITSVADYSQAEVVEEVQVDMEAAIGQGRSFRVDLSFSHKLRIGVLVDLVQNDNLANSDLVAIRVLETSSASKTIRIGTENSLNLASSPKIHPLLQQRFYDYEWGYLSQNLKDIDPEANTYQHLDKLTPSLPNYPHFANQELIDLSGGNLLSLQIDGEVLSIPIVYLMSGVNYLHSDKTSVKFFIDYTKQSQEAQIDNSKDRKRAYEMRVEEFWNVNRVNSCMDKWGVNEFMLKIINEQTYYFIKFNRRVVPQSQFRKESKPLDTRKEVTHREGRSYFSLQRHKKEGQLILVESKEINPFYLIEMTSSAAVSLQVTVKNKIMLEGALIKSKTAGSEGKSLVHLLSTVEGDAKVGLVLSFREVTQKNESVATFYHLRHRLAFAESGETDQVQYDIDIEYKKDERTKRLNGKLSPQTKSLISSGGLFLREFHNAPGIFTRQQTLTFTLRIRKMFFNPTLNYFDNQLLTTKTVSVNPTVDVIQEGKALMVNIQSECYDGIEVDLFDSNIKKRMKYYLEIYSLKNEFLDFRDSSYQFKIPGLLWNWMPQASQPEDYSIKTLLSRQKRNTSQYSLPYRAQQVFTLDHYNYNDGISVETGQEVGYGKFIKVIKMRCEALKNEIGWNEESGWYLGVVPLKNSNFYFMVQRLFDPYEDKKRDSSAESNKTASLGKTHRSDKHKIDPLARTINNLDLFKLKQKKNELIQEGRQLTARYVKREEKVIELTKKIAQIQETMRKKDQESKEKKTHAKKTENKKMKEFFRSICECGERNPQFKGFCEACLTKLKKRYEVYLKQYKERSFEYEKMVFGKFNQNIKIERMKQRIQRLKRHQVQEDDGQGYEVLLRGMEQRGVRGEVEELRVRLFDLQEERQRLLETSNYQMASLEAQITEEDKRIYQNSQECDALRNRLEDINSMMKKMKEDKSQA